MVMMFLYDLNKNPFYDSVNCPSMLLARILYDDFWVISGTKLLNELYSFLNLQLFQSLVYSTLNHVIFLKSD